MEALQSRTEVDPAPRARRRIAGPSMDAWWGNVTDGVERRDDARASTRDVSTRVGPSVSVLCRTRAQVVAAVGVDGKEEIARFFECTDYKAVCGCDAGKTAVVAGVLKRGGTTLAFLSQSRRRRAVDSIGGIITDAARMKRPPTSSSRRFAAIFPSTPPTLSRDVFLRSGLERLTPTHDLNAEQQRARRRARSRGRPSSKSSRTNTYQSFTNTASSVDSYPTGILQDCGHPCETSHVHLRDDRGDDTSSSPTWGVETPSSTRGAIRRRVPGPRRRHLTLSRRTRRRTRRRGPGSLDDVHRRRRGRRSPADALRVTLQTVTGAARARAARGEDRASSRRASSDRRGVSRGEREDTEIWARALVEPIGGVRRRHASRRRSRSARERTSARPSFAPCSESPSPTRACRGVLARDVPARVSSRVRVARASSRAAGSDAAGDDGVGDDAEGVTPVDATPRETTRELGNVARARRGAAGRRTVMASAETTERGGRPTRVNSTRAREFQAIGADDGDFVESVRGVISTRWVENIHPGV